jgi:hypothetical protein
MKRQLRFGVIFSVLLNATKLIFRAFFSERRRGRAKEATADGAGHHQRHLQGLLQ